MLKSPPKKVRKTDNEEEARPSRRIRRPNPKYQRESWENPTFAGRPAEKATTKSISTDTDESENSEDGKRIDEEFEKIIENFEELCIEVDAFKGDISSDESEHLDRKIMEKKRDLQKLCLDAKGSRKKKCKEYIAKVDALLKKMADDDMGFDLFD